MSVATDSEGLATVDDAGTPAPQRVKDYPSAAAMVKRAWDDDKDARYDRRCEQALLDGEPPYVQQELDAADQSYRSNDNWGRARALSELAKAPFHELASSVPRLLEVDELDYDGSDYSDEWLDICADGLSLLHTRWWSDYEFERQNLDRLFVDFGIGVADFPHATDWRWRSEGLDTLLFPKRMKASEGRCPWYAKVWNAQEHEIHQWIKDPKAARLIGFNVAEAQEAMRAASGETNLGDGYCRDFDQNSYGLAYSRQRSVGVRLFRLRCLEFDGTISECIGRLDAPGKDFIFRSRSKLQRQTQMADCFSLFTLGVGNSELHSVQGLARTIFPLAQTENQFINQMVDYGRRSMCQYWKAGSNDALDRFANMEFGPDTVVAPGVEVIERAFPNLGTSGIPVSSLLGQLMQSNLGIYQHGSAAPDGPAETLGAREHMLALSATLSSGAQSLYNTSRERLLNATVRRLCNPRYGRKERGFAERQRYLDYCKKRGVPEKAALSVRHVSPNSAMGNGNPALRRIAGQQAMALRPLLDPQAQRDLLFMNLSNLLGTGAARKLTPNLKAPRTPQQAINAQNEDNAFVQGLPQPVHADDDHFIHAGEHQSTLDHAPVMLSQGVLPPAQVHQALAVAMPHQEQHLGALAGDTLRMDEVKALRLAFNKTNQLFQQLDAKLRAAQNQEQQRQQAAAQAATAAPPAGSGPANGADMKAQVAMLKDRMQLEALQAQIALKLQGIHATGEARRAEKAANHEQSRALADADKAKEILSQPSEPANPLTLP